LTEREKERERETEEKERERKRNLRGILCAVSVVSFNLSVLKFVFFATFYVYIFHILCFNQKKDD
jgi:hypothetical protein